MVLGIEVSEVLDCGQYRRHAALHRRPDRRASSTSSTRLGVRSLFPVHKFDNALGGTAYDDGATGLLVNVGNKYATGEWWQPTTARARPRPTTRPPTSPATQAQLIYTVLGPRLTAPLLQGDLPVYPPGPLCNPKGLTTLGEHLIGGMTARGMIVETDHLSVKARRDALDDPRGATTTPA